MTFAAISLEARFVESARYALLRRLTPAIRHNLAGSLQPLSMVSAMLERRLQGDSPDLDKLAKSVSDIGTLSREAASVCMNLMTWLAPRDMDTVALNSGLAEALNLQSAELSFRGFALVNETADVALQVRRAKLRSLTLASLLALTDAAPGPARIVLSVQLLEGEALLRIELMASGAQAMPDVFQAYRPLGWDDVQALAAAEQIVISHSESCVELRFPAADAQIG